MRSWMFALLAVALLASGCESKRTLATGPARDSLQVSGRVTLPDNHVVRYAKVWIGTDSAHARFADSLGAYTIAAGGLGDSLEVSARDGFEPGQVYVVTHSGSRKVAVPPTHPDLNVDLVLDHVTPF